MPSKKKKYNSRFPPARIKKIMQTDDEIGKVAAAVPVLISKCLEMFLSSILTSAGDVTKSKRAKTMTTSHLKECIMNVSMFDFLKDVVANVPDMQNEDEPSTSSFTPSTSVPETKKISRKRSAASSNVTKKRSKTQQEASEEDDEESENVDIEELNGGLMLMSSPEQAVSEARSDASDEKKASFHISLDALMSQESIRDNPVCSDKVLHAPCSESKRTDSINVSKVVADSAAAIEKADPINGISSPQKPMDLTVNNFEARVSSKTPQVGSGKPEFRVPNFPPGVPLLNMQQVYNPMTTLPGLPPNAQAVFPKNTNAKTPHGEMLSLLYSGLAGDPLQSPPPDLPRSVDGHSSVKQATKPSIPLPEVAYPYNPVSEHHKRISYLPRTVESQTPSTVRVSSLQSKEDDDYDT